MPNLLDLLGQQPGIQQTQATGAPGVNTNAPPGVLPAGNPAAAQPMYTPPPSLWQRIQQNLMPTPQGLAGVLTDSDVSHARGRGLLDMGLSLLANSQGQGGGNAPGFGQALQAGVGAMRAGYGEDVNSALQGRVQGQQLQQQQLRAKVLERLRTQFPNFAQMSPQEQQTAIRGIFGELLSNGMFDDAGKFASVIPGLTGNANAGKAEWVDFGGYKALMTPDGKVLKTTPKTPNPRDPNAPDGAEQLRMSRRITAEQHLTDDYNKDTKTFRELGMVLSNAVAALPAALAGDGAAQTNVLYAFVKAMDPNSAVREGEIGLVQAAAGLRDRAVQILQKAGGSSAAVPPEMLREMAGLMEQRLASTADYINERNDYYTGLANRYGLENPGQLFPRMKAKHAGNGGGAGGSAKGNANVVRQLLGKP